MSREIDMRQEVQMEAGKGGIALAGGAVTAITLNQWVAIATIIYIVIQGAVLLHKHYYFVKEKKRESVTNLKSDKGKKK